MSRTTPDNVAKIVELDSTIDVQPFIDVANELVTECCGSVATYTSTRLELIERWLSAHFYSIRDMRPSSESAGSVSVSYQNRVDLGFANTMYGQQAMALDTNGGLALLNIQVTKGKRRVKVLWLGTSSPLDDDVIP